MRVFSWKLVLTAFLAGAFTPALAAAATDPGGPSATPQSVHATARRAVHPRVADMLQWLEQEVDSGGPAGTPPPAGHVKDQFGGSVAVKGDLAVIGVPIGDVTDNGSTVQTAGLVFVFARENGQWKKVAKLLPNVSKRRAVFGAGVAISSANTILVAAREYNVHGEYNVGAVFVFNKIDGEWTQTQKLLANDGIAYDQFGTSIAVDGQTAVIGASYGDPNGNLQAGQVYVFTEAAPGGT
jgi:hypothetical protein